jgi:hypothetical protein
MRKTLMAASALVGVALLASSAAEARKVTYIAVVPPPGAASVSAFSINDNNIIAGTYTDTGGLRHGFFGPLDGSNYTTFDFAGDGTTGTQPRAILNDGTITGIGLGGGFQFGEEFVRTPAGKFKVLKNGKLVLDGVVQGGNDADQFAGDYVNSKGIRTGFMGANAKYKSDIKLKLKKITSTDPRQINNHGVIGGSYIDSGGVQHGFVLDGKKLTTFDYPDAIGVTAPEGINDSGVVTGLWQDSGANRHGFTYDSTTGNFTSITGPNDGSTAQEAWGINNAGLVAGDSISTGTSWVYCPLAKKKCPKGGEAVEVDVRSIHVAPGKLMHASAKPVHNPKQGNPL